MASREANQPSPNEILSALKDSGFLLEQEVASSLESQGYRVWTNHPYIDQDESKEREVDVVALKTIPTPVGVSTSKVCINLVCSCKNNSYPLVLLSRKKNEADKKRTPEEYFFPISVRSKGAESHRPAFFREGLDKIHYYHKQNNLKSVLVCGVRREKKKWNIRNMDHELLLPVVKPYLAER